MRLSKLAILLFLLPSSALAGGPPAPGTTPTTIKVCVRSTGCYSGASGCTTRCFKAAQPNCSGDGPNCVPAPPNCSGCVLAPEEDEWIEALIDAGCEPVLDTSAGVFLDCALPLAD